MPEAQFGNLAGEASGPVYIVLATYDAATYLVQQIDSIRAQTFTAWTVLVRDDGSSDATLRILEDYASADSRIDIVRDGRGNLGAIGNFSRLASHALERGASVVFFADQDDVWLPDKVARILERMAAAAARLPAGLPILVHSDLQLVDGQGRLLQRSFMEFQRIHDAGANAATTLLVQNYVTGCAMAVNRPLLQLALPVPGAALMHDWWFALCAASCGSIEFVPEPTVSYRRHGANAVTVRGFWHTLNPLRTDWRDVWRTGRVNHARTVNQARALAARLAEITGTEKTASEKGESRGELKAVPTAAAMDRAATPAASALLDAFVRLHDAGRSPISRVAGAIRLRLGSQALPRTLALYLRLFRWRP